MLFPEFRVGEDGQKSSAYRERLHSCAVSAERGNPLRDAARTLVDFFDQLAAGVGVDAVDPEKQFGWILLVLVRQTEI